MVSCCVFLERPTFDRKDVVDPAIRLRKAMLTGKTLQDKPCKGGGRSYKEHDSQWLHVSKPWPAECSLLCLFPA